MWYHVAVTQSGPSSLPALYVDGVPYPVVVQVNSNPYHVAAPLSIGRQGGYPGSYFKGALDEVRIYNRALSEDEIYDLYTDTGTPDSDDDGISDNVDNCPGIANSDQLDSDSDGIGDVCEDEPNIAITETKKAKVRWHHGDIHVDGKLYLPEGVWMDDLSPVGSAVITLAEVKVTDQSVDLKTKGKKGDKWEFKAKKNDIDNIKEFKIDWKEAKFDYKGDNKFHIHTHGIGTDETTLCIHTGDISGAFTVTIDETTIIVYGEDGNIDTDATNVAYASQKSDSHVHFTLPFKLTSDMTIAVTGAVELSLDVAKDYDEAYAKFKLVSAFDATQFNGTDTLPDTLEYVISLGDDDPPVSWSDLIEAWTKQDDKHWEYK